MTNVTVRMARPSRRIMTLLLLVGRCGSHVRGSRVRAENLRDSSTGAPRPGDARRSSLRADAREAHLVAGILDASKQVGFAMVDPINVPLQALTESRALQLDRPASAPEPAMAPLASTFRRVLVPLDGSDLAE